MSMERISVTIAADAFNPDETAQTFRKAYRRSGAIVTFVGHVRCERNQIEALCLEHYAGFTEAEIIAFAGDATRRWPLDGVQIVHRVGMLTPETPIVFVAAAASHRRAAFEAVDFLMDYLKSDAPFWKKEILTNGEDRWVEPSARDYQDKARWEPKRSLDARR